MQPLGQLGERAARRLVEAKLEVTLRLADFSILAHEPAAGRQLVYAFERRPRGGHVLQAEEGVDRLDVRAPLEVIGLRERTQLRCEDQALAPGVIEQRLLTESIPCEDQPPPWPIPERDRKHPAQAIEEVHALFFVEMDDHFGVGARLEKVAFCLELASKLLKVVDLAIDHDRDRAVLVGHRLRTFGSQVDDRETAMPERAGPVAQVSVVIGAAMHHRVAHAPNRLAVGRASGG